MAAISLNDSHCIVSLSLSLSSQPSSLSVTLSLSLSQTVTMTQRRIDSYFLRSSSSSSTASTVIEIDSDASTDDEQPSVRKRLRSRSTSSQQSIEAYLISPNTRSSSAGAARRADIRRSVVRRALSDISNVRQRDPRQLRVYAARYYGKRRNFYLRLRARLAHPDDNTMCAKCGIREHTALHHEADFRRAGTDIRAPSLMSPPALAAEVERCTRPDGSIGLVSLCYQCHCEETLPRTALSGSSRPPWVLRSVERNRAADAAAKIARGECECDDKCGQRVTLETVSQFEWDHLVQSFDDPDYHLVSALVGNGSALARCDRERKKCRLLYGRCHRLHSGVQCHQAAERGA
jgi:hypothetical protein